MAQANWRSRFGAWVGGFGVPGGFDATSGQRRLKGFTTSRAHVNALIAASGPEMNARARWLVRNNGFAANAIESWAATIQSATASARIPASPKPPARMRCSGCNWPGPTMRTPRG